MKIKIVHRDRYSPKTNPVSGKLARLQARALAACERT